MDETALRAEIDRLRELLHEHGIEWELQCERMPARYGPPTAFEWSIEHTLAAADRHFAEQAVAKVMNENFMSAINRWPADQLRELRVRLPVTYFVRRG